MGNDGNHLLISLLAIGLIYSSTIVGTFLVILQRLLRITLRESTLRYVDEADVPIAYREIFAPTIDELVNLGFDFWHYGAEKSLLVLSSQDNWFAVLYHSNSATCAKVSVRFPVQPISPCEVDFCSFLPENLWLFTYNGKAHGIIDELPNSKFQDLFCATLEIQWNAHQKFLEQEAESYRVKPIELEPESFILQVNEWYDNYLSHLQRKGCITLVKSEVKSAQDATDSQDEPRFQLSWRTAWQTSLKLRQGQHKFIEMYRQKALIAQKEPNLIIDLPIDIDIDSFHRMQHIENGTIKRGFSIWLLLITLILSAASFAVIMPFATGSFLLVFIGVLGFHELGHLLAMRAFGYQDTSVFFIPFFGAAAVGKKQDASMIQKFVILLAGPLPGILVGIALMVGKINFKLVYPEWIDILMYTAILLNFLNLIPIYPLDGGKIADLLLFSRNPYTDVIFKAVAVAFFVAFSGGSPWIWMIAGVVALTIPNGFKSAKLFNQFQKKLKDDSKQNREQFLRHIFELMRELGYHKLNFTQRYGIAKNILERSREIRAHWRQRLGLAGIYLFSLLGLPGILIASYVPHDLWQNLFRSSAEMRQIARERSKKNLQRQLAEVEAVLQAVPNDRQALMQRAELNQHSLTMDLYDQRIPSRQTLSQVDYRAVLADYTKAIRLNPKDANIYLKRAAIYLQQKNYPNAIADYTSVLELTSNIVSVRQLRLNAYQASNQFALALKDANILLDGKGNYLTNGEYLNLYKQRSLLRSKLGDTAGAKVDTKQVELITAKLEAAKQRRKAAIELKDPQSQTELSEYESELNLDDNDRKKYQQRQSGETQARIINLTQAIAFSPKDRKVYIDRGDAYYQIGNHQAAIADYTQAIAIYGKDTDVLAKRAESYFANKEFNLALLDSNQVVSLKPQSPRGYTLRIKINKALHNQTAVKEDSAKLEELYRYRSDLY